MEGYVMEIESTLTQNSRKVYLKNESKDLNECFKTLRDIAIKGNPYDRCVIEYLEEEFYRAIDSLIEKASKMQ